MAEREIRSAWLTQVLQRPEKTEPDAEDPSLRHALGRIAEYGNRALRVVYNGDSTVDGGDRIL